jgi:hypothetical protein
MASDFLRALFNYSGPLNANRADVTRAGRNV